MAYSELIKDFSRIRDYMRDFYIYGFKRRDEYDAKSARSYDNERRRIESWLGGHMAFRQGPDGKRVFISIDSRSIIHNPLYKAFKAKSFTAKDIMLHFFILDALACGISYTVSELVDMLENEYAAAFDSRPGLEQTTLRLKLKEYEKLGLLTAEKRGKLVYYSLCLDDVPLGEWKDALAFYSEEDPLGVVGSYLLDRLSEAPEYFRFKHHYMLHALESEVLFGLLTAIDEKRRAEIEIYSPRHGKPSYLTVTPLIILVSTQGGRRYLLAYAHSARRMKLYRLDTIKAARPLEPDEAFEGRKQEAFNFMSHLWGVSSGNEGALDHIEMIIRVNPGEEHIPARLIREKRCGAVDELPDGLYRFTADVYDAAEMMPWLRTFIGRIVSLECSNKYVRETFLADLSAMENMYLGGGPDAVS